MDRTVSPTQDSAQRNPATHPGSDPHSCPPPATPRGPDLIAITAFTQTLLHFFPHFNDWLDQLPDTRVPEACTYETRFLVWAGLLIFLLQLGSRRQLDYTLEAYSSANLA